MKRIIVFLSLMFVVTAIAGCIFDSDDGKGSTVRKGSVSGTVKMILTGEPVPGVKVLLVNRDVKADTTDYGKSYAAFVDSAVTGADGSYVFGNIAPGNYGVAPVKADTTAVYKFTSAAGSDSCLFAMNGDSLSVNFIAEKQHSPGIDNPQIRMRVDFLNGQPYRVISYRRWWIVFVPFFTDGSILRLFTEYNQVYTIDQFVPGYTAVVATIDNCWKYEVNYDDTKTRSFEIYLPLNTPAGSEIYFSYDLSTGTLTRI